MKNVLHSRDRRDLLDRLRAVTPTSGRRWGRMSPHQMVCHLADVCRVSLGERRATPVGNLLAHTLIKSLVLYTPAPIPKEQSSAPETES